MHPFFTTSPFQCTMICGAFFDHLWESINHFASRSHLYCVSLQSDISVGDVESFCETFVQTNFLAIRVISLNIHGSFVRIFRDFWHFPCSNSCLRILPGLSIYTLQTLWKGGGHKDENEGAAAWLSDWHNSGKIRIATLRHRPPGGPVTCHLHFLERGGRAWWRYKVESEVALAWLGACHIP